MTYNIEDMFPADIDACLAEGKDMAILPIGSVEQHGPHLLLGCDSLGTIALAEFTAEASGAFLFPLIPFSWIGGLRVWPGTIDMRPGITGDYMEDVCESIIKMGFKKLLVINCHGGGREMVFSVVSRLYRRTGIPVLAMYPSKVYDMYPELHRMWEDYGIKQMDWANYEAGAMLGALKKMGRMDLVEKVQGFIQEALARFGEGECPLEPTSLLAAYKLGEVGFDHLGENMHVTPRKNSNPDAGLAVLEATGKKLAIAMQQLKEYHNTLGI